VTILLLYFYKKTKKRGREANFKESLENTGVKEKIKERFLTEPIFEEGVKDDKKQSFLLARFAGNHCLGLPC